MSTTTLLPAASAGTTFVEVAGHPLRWGLLRELARSDRKVRELAGILRERQGLVSYHLMRLRKARLVSMRRSAADGRDAYYTIDLARCGELIAATAEALHPGLKLQLAPAPSLESATSGAPVRILFLCTGNSSRSQMAEALTGSLGAGVAIASSAGSHPKSLHPLAVQIMEQRDLDISGWRSKNLDEFLDKQFDVVVTLCDRVREVCPEFPGTQRLVHWSIPDPADPEADSEDGDTSRLFRDVADDIAVRIHFLLRDLPPPRQQQMEKQNAR